MQSVAPPSIRPSPSFVITEGTPRAAEYISPHLGPLPGHRDMQMVMEEEAVIGECLSVADWENIQIVLENANLTLADLRSERRIFILTRARGIIAAVLYAWGRRVPLISSEVLGGMTERAIRDRIKQLFDRDMRDEEVRLLWMALAPAWAGSLQSYERLVEMRGCIRRGGE